MTAINTEALITLVEERPVIWDKTLEIYRDKNLKVSAWKEICVLLEEDFERMEKREKEDFCKLVVKKWTQTRDSWMRSIKKRGKSSNPSTKRSRLYIYHKEMSFLKKIIDRAVTRESTDELRIEGSDEETGTEENESETTRNEENSKDTVEKKCTSDTQSKRKISEDEKNRQANLLQKEDYENHHLLFFKSILPFLSSFDDDQTLEFQSSVLNSLQKIKRQKKTPLNNKSQKNYYEWLSSHSGYTSRQHTKFSP